MALIFQTPIVTVEGFQVANAYGRVAVVDPFAGTSLVEQVNIYATEAAFEAGYAPLNTQLQTSQEKAYDRTTGSTDILDIAHDDLIALLASQGVEATKSL